MCKFIRWYSKMSFKFPSTSYVKLRFDKFSSVEKINQSKRSRSDEHFRFVVIIKFNEYKDENSHQWFWENR